MKLLKDNEYEKFSDSVEKIYDISSPTIYSWIHKAHYNKKSIQVVEMKDSQAEKIKQMRARIEELEQVLGQKQMNIDYLEKIIDLAKEQLHIDIKKNSNKPSGDSKTTGKN